MRTVGFFLLDTLGYIAVLFGIGTVLLGFILLSAKDTPHLKGLAFLIGGVASIALGIAFMYYAARKDKKRFKEKIFDWFIFSLLPPWK